MTIVTLDWGSSEIRSGVATKASSYGTLLDRCNSIASDDRACCPNFAGWSMAPKQA